MKKKSIRDMLRQRNRIQERLINSGAWHHHPQMYRQVDKIWQRYVKNIEKHTGKELYKEDFCSIFTCQRYPKEIYAK